MPDDTVTDDGRGDLGRSRAYIGTMSATQTLSAVPVKPGRTPDTRAALFGGGLSLLLLCGAWVFQYGFGYPPCIMCYWQRYAHMAVIATAAAILAWRGVFGASGLPRWLAIGLLLAGFAASAGLAFYHVGVEQGVFAGPQLCAADAGGAVAYDINDPLAVLDERVKGPSCADVVWSFLGISMAGWNGILSLFGLAGVARLGLKGGRA